VKRPRRQKIVDLLPSLLRKLRTERLVSMRVLAHEAGVNASVVSRVELGQDALLSTWEALFEGLGYSLEIEALESSEEGPEIPAEKSERRRERRRDGLDRG